MGIFIFLGVCFLFMAKVTLLAKILWTKNCTGISGKTQLLYGIIFAGRYLDIITTYYTCPINVSLSRVTFAGVSYCTVLSIFFFYSRSYQSQYDKFRIELLIFPCLVLSMLANYGFDIIEIFWAFSIYLESVAILPQIYFASRVKHVENIVYYYISLLSVYKLFFLMDGIYRFYVNEPYDRISLAAGIVQLMFYCDFFIKDLPLKGEVRGNDDDISVVVVNDPKPDDKSDKKQEFMTQTENYTTHANLGEILLTPAFLLKDDKITVAMPAKPEEKKIDDTTVKA